MGIIKSKLIKRTAKTLLSENSHFTADFENNKKQLEGIELPDKHTRNKIAGYLARLKKAENKKNS